MLTFSPRGRLVRDAIIFTPLFLLCLALLLLMIAGVVDRAIVGMVILAIVCFLFGYQSIQSLRDLATEPSPHEGLVVRRWSKRDAFVAKSYYITVEKAIFRISAETYLDVIAGDTVRVTAYPHSGTVLGVEKLKEASLPEEAPAARAEVRLSTGRMRTLRTARATPSSRRSPDAPPAVGPAESGDSPSQGRDDSAQS